MITRDPRARRAVDRVRPGGVKLNKRPTSAVTAKLNPIENVALSIVSIESSRGKIACVRQYPGKIATRIKANMYLM